MIIFPAVDIQDGKAVRLKQGRAHESTVFSPDPVAAAVAWRDKGARWLHVVDLDGAFDGLPKSRDIVRNICRELDIPVQLGGGIRDEQTARAYLEAGVQRLIIGTMALEQPEAFASLCKTFPGQIGVSLDAEGGRLKTKLKYFKKLFTGPDFWTLFRNTLSISLANLFFAFPAPIILALILNELRCKWFKRTAQTLVYIPHFVSIVIVAALTFQMFSTTDGAIYHVLTQIFGANAPDLLSDPKLFPALIVGQNIWKETGYGTIIYLAALSSVDVQLYEAAKIDGAGRWQLMWHVTLPAIRGTIVLMLIMKVGQLLNTSYEQIFLMQNSMNRAASDVFDTYVYTKGITGGQYSLATATGLFKSTISMLMVVTANKIAKLCGESGLY